MGELVVGNITAILCFLGRLNGAISVAQESLSQSATQSLRVASQEAKVVSNLSHVVQAMHNVVVVHMMCMCICLSCSWRVITPVGER